MNARNMVAIIVTVAIVATIAVLWYITTRRLAIEWFDPVESNRSTEFSIDQRTSLEPERRGYYENLISEIKRPPRGLDDPKKIADYLYLKGFRILEFPNDAGKLDVSTTITPTAKLELSRGYEYLLQKEYQTKLTGVDDPEFWLDAPIRVRIDRTVTGEWFDTSFIGVVERNVYPVSTNLDPSMNIFRIGISKWKISPTDEEIKKELKQSESRIHGIQKRATASFPPLRLV